MGWLLILLTAFVAGVLFADLGGTLEPVDPFGGRIHALVGAAALVAGSFVAGLGGRVGRGLVAALVFAIAFAAGHHGLERELGRARRGAALARSSANAASGSFRLVDARVVARRPTGFGEEVELRDVRARAGEAPVPERLLVAWTRAAPVARDRADAAGRGDEGAVDTRADRLLWPGARVRLALRIEPLRPTRNPGTPDREHALARRGIGARGRLLKPDWVVETISESDLSGRLEARLVALRREAVTQVETRLPGDRPGAALVRAFALGDRRDLAEATRRTFRDLGLAHLLSVSGLHIGFVALPTAAAVGRLRVLWRPRARPVLGFGLPIAAGCLVALCYAGLTGGSVPALRASLSFVVLGAARGLGRTLAPGRALAVVALALLVSDPATLFEPGARFSFSACAALVGARRWSASPEGATLASPRAAGSRLAHGAAFRGASRASATRGHRMLEAFVDPMRASLAVSFGLLPWLELEGLPRSLPSPLINALAIPWAGLVVLPSALAAVALALGLPEGRGELVLHGLLWPSVALEQGAGWLASGLVPEWTGTDRAGRLPWAVGAALIAFGFLVLRRGRLLWAALLWLVLGSLGLAPIRETRFSRERPRIVFFDVGQADAALVETRDAAWLIDSGPGSEEGTGGGTVLRALRALGVERLDGLVITHGDLDHRGGALRLLTAIPIGELWLPALPRADPALVRLAEEAMRRGVRVVHVVAGDRRHSGRSLVLDVLWPPPLEIASGGGAEGKRSRGSIGDDGWRLGRGRNERSIVLRASIDGRSLLFMADVGSPVEERLRDRGERLGSEILKLGHHGSRQSSAPGFLAAVAAELALVSAPCDAARGLPSPDALERARAAGSRIAWTGRDGAVAIGWDADGRRWMQTWGRMRDCGAEMPTSVSARRRLPSGPDEVAAMVGGRGGRGPGGG